MTESALLAPVGAYYTAKVATHGPTASGVDWNSVASQELRFEQLLKLCGSRAFSVNDYGCGYGALVEYMTGRDCEFSYCGFDISDEMLAAARTLHDRRSNCVFVADEAMLPVADYTVASGILNVKLDATVEAWERHVLATLDRLHELSTAGFGFNVLTAYSDAERRRPHLYYADPCRIFDHCKRRYSRNVALLHDYELYEFTILVRK